jgi:hypothetical protein
VYFIVDTADIGIRGVSMNKDTFIICLFLLYVVSCFVIYDFGYDRGVEKEREDFTAITNAVCELKNKELK